MTRLFRDGRTETVRSCSIESTQWVKSMDDPTISVKKSRILFELFQFDFCREVNELNYFVMLVIIINNNIVMQ
jgi:hypothetical protein